MISELFLNPLRFLLTVVSFRLASFAFVFSFVPSVLSHDFSPAFFELNSKNKVDVTDQFAYYQYPQGQVPDTLVELQKKLPKMPTHLSTNTFGDRFLATLDVANNIQHENWFLYPSGAIVENIHIFIYRNNDFVETFSTGHNHINQIDHHYGGQIKIKPGEKVTIAMLFDSGIYSSPVGISFMPYSTAESKLKKENLLLLLSVGVCIALALYNLFLYYGTKQLQYLFYSLATFGFTLGWSQAFGIFNFVFGVSPPEWIVIPFFFGFIFIALFTSHFLQLRTTSPRLDATLRLMAFLSFICLPVSFLSLGASLLLASLFSTIILIVSLYSGIKSWRNNYSPAKYFVFALLAVLTPNIVGNFLNMGLLPGVEINVYLLSQLGNSLDSLLLAFALAEKVRLLNEQNRTLTNELEERVKRRTEELSGANDKLEKLISELRDADDAKNVFLANMSHEIRTPLTAIIGYADGMLKGDIPPDEFKNSIGVISQNGNHLVSIISDILDLSKVEAKKLEFEIIQSDLSDILQQVSGLLKVRADEKEIDFIVDCQYPLPSTLLTDPTRLKQILFNLVSNAIKFTDSGYVNLSVSALDNRLYFQVKDTGIGMTDSQIEKLFMPFEQGEKAINRQYGGTGLGLSISKHLISGLGGEISVTSEPTQGTTFTFFLPLHKEKDIEWVDQFPPSNLVKDTETFSLPDFDSAPVLLVDDHEQNRELISRLLTKMNISVSQAKSGTQALEHLDQHPDISLILLDIQMPHMGGVETLSKIRERGIEVPVIALTANSMEHEIKEYLDKGFSDHLGKPLIRELFIQKLAHYLPFKSSATNPLTRTDMLEMSRDYFEDLKRRLIHFEKASARSDYERMQDIAHAIKGSAGSFGFQPFSELFEKIELALKANEYHKVSELLSELQTLSYWTIKSELIDIPLAIANSNNSLDDYLVAVKAFLPNGYNTLKRLGQSIAQRDKNNALVHLIKFKSECHHLALAKFEQQCQKIIESIRSHEWEVTESSAFLFPLHNQIEELIKQLEKP